MTAPALLAVGKKTPTFAADDVWAVARALLSEWCYTDDSGRSEMMLCRFCGPGGITTHHSTFKEDFARFPHDLTCPVLKARDLLTGAPHPG